MNIQGISLQTVPYKVPFIQDLLDIDNELFFGLAETWLKDHKDAETLLRVTPYSVQI